MSQANAYDYEDIIRCTRGELFGPNSVRLPSPNMLMLDRVVNITEDGGQHGKGEAIAELDIRPDLWFFGCHFPDDPLMPGSLGIEGLLQLTGFFLAWKGYQGKVRAMGVDEVRFSGEARPSAKVVAYHIQVRRLVPLKLTMCVADGTVSVDGREIYTAKGLRCAIARSEV